MGQAKDELLKIMPALNGSGKARDLMKLFSRKIRFDLAGEGGPFDLVIEEGQMQLAAGVSGGADIVVTGEAAEFARVVGAGVDVTHPIARGRLVVVKGKISEMTLLNRILWATKGS